jgi:hypothetical protein
MAQKIGTKDLAGTNVNRKGLDFCDFFKTQIRFLSLCMHAQTEQRLPEHVFTVFGVNLL